MIKHYCGAQLIWDLLHLLVAQPTGYSLFYLDKIHRCKPHEVPVSGELPEVLCYCDWFVWMGRWARIDSQSGGGQKKGSSEINGERKHTTVQSYSSLTPSWSVLQPVSQGLPFGNGAVAPETQIKIPRRKKLPKRCRRVGRSKSPPYSRKSRREIRKLSPERWTRNSGSWGVFGRRPTQRGRPAARCGGGPPEWGTHHTDTGTTGTGAPDWPRTPRKPGRTGQKGGHLLRALWGAAAPPLNLWSESLTWKTKWQNGSFYFLVIMKVNCTIPGLLEISAVLNLA